MPYKKSINIVAQVGIKQCFEILKEVGVNVDGYELIDSSTETFSLIWRKGSFLTPPVKVRADLSPFGHRQTQVSISAEIGGLLDALGLTTKAIELFERPFKRRLADLAVSENEISENSIKPPLASIADEIRKIAKLKEEGLLSEGEFLKLKNKLLCQ